MRKMTKKRAYKILKDAFDRKCYASGLSRLRGLCFTMPKPLLNDWDDFWDSLEDAPTFISNEVD